MAATRRRAHPERGQGTVEYVAAVTLVALVMAAAVAGAVAFGPGISNAVVAQVHHALCIVTGSACTQPAPRPCVVRASRDLRRESLELAVLRLGADRVVLRERLSDGTLRLTVLHGADAALMRSFGPRTRVRIGRLDVDVGAHARATVGALASSGQVFEVRTAAEADAILRRLGARGSSAVDVVRRAARRVLGGDDALPRPDVSFVQGGVLGSLDGGASPEIGGEVTGSLTGERVLGRRVDHRTGETTWYLALHQGASLFASSLVGSASGTAEGDALLAVTTDRSGRATELSAVVGGRLEAAAEAAAGGPLAGLAGDVSTGGTRWEGEARVDLGDPVVRAALDAWRGSPASAARVRGLAQALAERATLDVRSYARDAHGDDDGLAVGDLAVGRSTSREDTRLLRARTRPPGGLWEARADCLAAA